FGRSRLVSVLGTFTGTFLVSLLVNGQNREEFLGVGRRFPCFSAVEVLPHGAIGKYPPPLDKDGAVAMFRVELFGTFNQRRIHADYSFPSELSEPAMRRAKTATSATPAMALARSSCPLGG